MFAYMQVLFQPIPDGFLLRVLIKGKRLNDFKASRADVLWLKNSFLDKSFYIS